MAKFFEMGKGKKRLVSVLSLFLSTTLALGIFSACNPEKTDNEDDENKVTATDTQLLKNGNFEFYGEMDGLDEDGNKKEHKQDDLRALINSPNDWSFSSGSPSSNTSSGIVNTADWAYMAQSKQSLILESDRWEKAKDGDEQDGDGYKLENDKRVEATSGTLTDAAVANAKAKWDEASVYDRLEFYDFYDVDSASEFELYDDYKYSIDFNDLEYLKNVAADSDNKLALRGTEGENGRKADETSVLMIHNHTTLNNIAGTAQYYTSSTTVTLKAGTAAKLSVWVRTSELYHYAVEDENKGVPVEARAGAYIGVTNTVGGTTLDQMRIKNINTHDQWENYTVYIRANTFASSTFRVVLGLGEGTSSNRYYSVNGYAFFDDVTCDVISTGDFDKAVADGHLDQEVNAEGLGNYCDLNSTGKAKEFLATKDDGTPSEFKTFALDLDKTEEYKSFKYQAPVALTKEVSGSQTYTSEKIDPKSLADTRNGDGNTTKNNIGELMSLNDMAATGNVYLKYIYEHDFKDDMFPFLSAEARNNIVMLLSTNGAAYTATVNSDAFKLEPKERKLISFFVKTSEIRSGKTGASAILVDGENRSTIAAFDSTTVETVDIEGKTDETTVKDIYKGWVRCFFFVQNETEENKEFHLEFTYGPTSIASSSRTDYSDGYAAFANLQICDLTKTQFGYAATGTYAQKVSLTASVKDSTKFDDPAANGTQLEDGLAIPVNYTGVQAGSNYLVQTTQDEDGKITNGNPGKEALAKSGLYTGLLSRDYADNYLDLDPAANANAEGEDPYYPNKWMSLLNPEDVKLPEDTNENRAERNAKSAAWWKSVFGNVGTNADAAYQPIVIVNTSQETLPGYGFFAANATVSSNATTRISVRVKLSQSATAYFYLTDVSDLTEKDKKSLAPTLPAYTYWYDDDGNIVKGDPTADGFDEKNDILYTLETNGLYKKVGDTTNTYYANLSSFERDDEHNYVTKDGTVAFFHNPTDTDENTAYAYYDKNTDSYSQPVLDLPHTEGVRYAYPQATLSKFDACIKVQGTAENAGKWVTVSFYVQGGNEDKEYRLELWAGARDAYQTKDKDGSVTYDNLQNGIPGESYFFFDRVSTTTVSNYDTLLSQTKEAMLDYKDAEGNYPYRAENPKYAADPEHESKQLKDKVAEDFALYYTFTFYDSPDYLRYDESQDEDKLGNPWGSYVQSSHEETLMALALHDDGDVLGSTLPTATLFLSYASNEVTVTPDELGDQGSSDSNNNSSSSSTTPSGETNIWLLLSSILLAAALVFAIIAVGVRRLLKKYHKSSKAPKAKAPKRPKLQVLEPTEPEKEEEPAPAAEPKKEPAKPDENDPYNE